MTQPIHQTNASGQAFSSAEDSFPFNDARYD